MRATTDWAEQLAGWAIPDEILDAAPENPYAFPPHVITTSTVDPRQTPTGHAILEALTAGGRILDVGCGAGRISKAFADEFEVLGVEPRPNLAETAREVGLEVIEGRWPDAADQVGSAEVVLCTHVLYDVAAAGPFLRALHDAAGRRVVLEVTDDHPWSETRPLFAHFHDLPRPPGPSAEMLAAMIEEVLDVTPQTARWSRPRVRYERRADLVADHRRMLCLTANRDHEVDAQLAGRVVTHPDGTASLPDQGLTTLWWDVGPDGDG